MEVVSVKLMYLCHVLQRLSKQFPIITFDVAWLTKSDVMRWNTTLAPFPIVWFISFKVLQKGEIFGRSSQPKQSYAPQLVHQLLKKTTNKSLKWFLTMGKNTIVDRR